MKPSLCDKESHQSSWCVTWPGPCHHRAPVVSEKKTPLSLPLPHLGPLIAIPEGERGGETDRKRESRQRPCECVIWNRFSANDPRTPPLIPPLCAHPLPPVSSTPIRPGQCHPFVRNASLFQLRVPQLHPFTPLTLPRLLSWFHTQRPGTCVTFEKEKYVFL